jgi:hypothetical protein
MLFLELGQIHFWLDINFDLLDVFSLVFMTERLVDSVLFLLFDVVDEDIIFLQELDE